MGNIGSEVGRAVNWQKKDNIAYRDKALERAFELLSLTILDKRWKTGRKELCRAREILADVFYGDRIYGYSGESIERYFFQFACVVRK
ncbi:MAG: hypothetical protein COX81_00175 [Candidatus Magasanikbacteria bacterium CG_4_10_14_0_2_um_filter_37_12]|uniref:Uncharacterized protein n=1 Tax=Candidatus Magasanikbacteria bacterium CG_4_10_14_0_2_um_filter_37_12 TaxID=1974637 RepID=A0A2M7VAU7_9BACT|nr:MAG: hypothetical protein COX81_00175 [Candidatus Magasanikbacteria bacterium CG_4_10_14_0_2_um_filter_37_12]